MAPALAVVLALATGGLAGCDSGSGPSLPSTASAPAQAPPWFEDITARAGLDYVQRVEMRSEYDLATIMAPGAAFLDFDNDGRLDLYLIHNIRSRASDGGSTNVSPARALNRLYHQETDGRWRDVSAGSGLDVLAAGNGLAVGDVNNDGLPDLLMTEADRVRLFLNRGRGRFLDVTEAAGLTNRQWSVTAAFVDYDRDGWLDLVIGNYLDFDPAQRCLDARGLPEFCGPREISPTLTRLWHNAGVPPSPALNGPGGPGDSPAVPRFVDVTVEAGLARAPGKAMQIVCADFDGDRWPDIFVTDDEWPNRLFINRHNGTFGEEAVMRGVAYTGMGALAANMGIAIGDADNDGLFDLFVPHLGEENHTLWRQTGRGLFQDATAGAGLLNMPWHGTGFGTVFGDFDCDGDLDLAVVNGRIRRPASRGATGPALAVRQPTTGGGGASLDAFWRPYAEPAQLLANEGRGQFVEVSGANAAFCGEAAVGRGLAMGDVDNDGGLDLLAVGVAGPARLVRNVAKRGHWLGFRLVDPMLGGRDAAGAEIIVVAGRQRFWRLAHPAFSYASSHDPRVHVGLGGNARIDAVEVRWPDGSTEFFPGPPPDRYVTLAKGSGRTDPPRP
jgi:hypothetical protein